MQHNSTASSPAELAIDLLAHVGVTSAVGLGQDVLDIFFA